MTTLTWTAIFGGLSSTLKEQSGEKKYMGVSTYPIAIIWKYKIAEAKIVCRVIDYANLKREN